MVSFIKGQARQQLEDVQSALVLDPLNSNLYEVEQLAISSLKKWQCVEESALRQKERMKWLESYDSALVYLATSFY